MKRFAFALSVLLVLIAAAPVSAAQRAPTGAFLSLFAGDQDYPANTAFHMRGGVGAERGPSAAANGRAYWTLEMDGASVPATLHTVTTQDDSIVRFWYVEFPDGLTGVHTFVGRYYLPCGEATQFPCNGSRANTVLLAAEIPASINFVP